MTIELSHTVAGSGRPIVVLHGLFGSKRNWFSITKALAPHHHVFALDLRNHGDSPWIDGMAYPDMAEDVASFIRHHRLGPCPVIGHSMGGKVAMLLALQHGELVERLVAVDIAPVPSGGDFRDYVEALAGVPLAECETREEVSEFLEDDIPDPSLRGFLLLNIKRDADGLSWKVNLAALHQGMNEITGFPDLLPHHVFTGKSLFLAGERSDYVHPVKHLAQIRRLFPHAKLDHIPGAGHWVHADQPQMFLERLKRFLET